MAALGGINVDQVRYAPSGHVYFAPTGSAAPTDATTALTTAWYDVGYIDEDGVSITPTVDLGDVRAWQTAARLKRTVNSVDFEVAFKMMQVNKTVLSTYFFGGATTQLAAGGSKMDLPSNITISALTVALVVDWTDDVGAANRFYFPRGILGDREVFQLMRTDNVKPGLTYSVNDFNGSFGSHFSNNLDLYS
jgi:hypothetical protein